MTTKSIVIVDRSRSIGFALRQCLADSHDTVHVFGSFRSALQMIEHKKIDAALVEFDTDKETTAFCEEARARGIPIVYASSPAERLDLQKYGFSASFTHLPHAPRLPIQYGRHS
jgi:DNA-binding response OmpR family regulator